MLVGACNQLRREAGVMAIRGEEDPDLILKCLFFSTQRRINFRRRHLPASIHSRVAPCIGGATARFIDLSAERKSRSNDKAYKHCPVERKRKARAAKTGCYHGFGSIAEKQAPDKPDQMNRRQARRHYETIKEREVGIKSSFELKFPLTTWLSTMILAGETGLGDEF